MTKHDAASGRADLSAHTNSVWLPAGTQRTVLIDAAATPSLFSESGSVVVEVGFDPAGEVVASIDGDTLGEFDGESSAQLSPSLRQLESRGLVALAHGFFTVVDDAPAVTVHADPLGILPAPDETGPGAQTHPVTDPFLATESFAADEEAEASARAADEAAAGSVGTTAVRRKPQSRSLQAAAVLASALAIGLVGVVGFYYGAHERGQELTAYMNSKGHSTQSEHPATSAKSATPVSSTSSEPDTTGPVSSPAPSTGVEPSDERASSGRGEYNGQGRSGPAPGAAQPSAVNAPPPVPAPAPAPPAPAVPAPNPAPAPAPNEAPLPAPPQGEVGGTDDVPPLQPILELRW